MIKIDLHIHTISTQYNKPFNFSIDALKEYVYQRKIDIIAITNHNIFIKSNYDEIVNAIPDKLVLPGIELTILPNKWHLLIIANPTNIEDFIKLCNSLNNDFYANNQFPTLHDIMDLFKDKNEYLLIPHYKKDPSIDEDSISALSSLFFCGEVGSQKKFINCKKTDTITPLLFSDFRPSSETNINNLSIRQTYINLSNYDFAKLKYALKDKTNVSLSKNSLKDMFEVIPDFNISSGLNVVIGGRSSGKTHLLDEIASSNENVMYIKQFELLEKDYKDAEKTFNKKIQRQESDFSEKYLTAFKNVVFAMKEVSLKNDSKSVQQYLSSLLANANENYENDCYSSCTMFKMSAYTKTELKTLKELLKSFYVIYNNYEYRNIIDEYIPTQNIYNVIQELSQILKEKIFDNCKKGFINNIIQKVKSELSCNTSVTSIQDCDFYQIAINKVKVSKFNKLVNVLQESKTIGKKTISGFTAVATRQKFSSCSDLKDHTGIKTNLSDQFNNYSNPYEYLQSLFDNENIADDEYYKAFVKISYYLLNKYNVKVSGGERSEYNLIKKLNEANNKDLIVIDEPESSFDNIFLSQTINERIKSLSTSIPVILATHNATVGLSIQPDFIIYTKRQIENGEANYKIYYGPSGDKQLTTLDGEQISTHDVLLDYLEAGEDIYKERRQQYEMLKDRQQ